MTLKQRIQDMISETLSTQDGYPECNQEIVGQEELADKIIALIYEKVEPIQTRLDDIEDYMHKAIDDYYGEPAGYESVRELAADVRRFMDTVKPKEPDFDWIIP